MKKLLLNTFVITCLAFNVQAQTTHVIKTSGATYSPNAITIIEGDKVTITAGSSHPLIQVDKATWDANSDIQLSGGFSSSSTVTIPFPTAGVYYFVCGFHVFNTVPMKGMITVTRPTGLLKETSSTNTNGVRIYPNPAVSDLMIQLEQATQVQTISLVNAQGMEVSNQAINSSITTHTLNVSNLESGLYQVVISTPEKKIYNKVVVR